MLNNKQVKKLFLFIFKLTFGVILFRMGSKLKKFECIIESLMKLNKSNQLIN